MQFNRITLALLASFTFINVPISAHQTSKHTAPHQSGRIIVESYTAAYNSGDVEAMGRLMHNDIQWLMAKDNKIDIVTQGKSAMMSGLRSYFESPVKVTSTLSGWGENGHYVSVVETASWATKSGDRLTQSSNVIYQIENGLIRRVWYFPEQLH